MKKVALLRASVKAYIRFWIVLDNPNPEHVRDVKSMAEDLNRNQLQNDCNYYVNVIHYGENRGASYARNIGYNYSTADWVLFLDDDVIPDDNILDAYIGAIYRYPSAKVFVGLTALPRSFNLWTEMLRTCNIMFFYGVANHMVHPPWGVTANLMVAGSRKNPTVQFKHVYPKTGGGEDIDFVFQLKEWYNRNGPGLVVGVPGAKAKHPWWNGGNLCYGQINGWAWGDSKCITEWPEKTFLSFPNWIEYIVFVVIPLSVLKKDAVSGIIASVGVFALRHFSLVMRYYSKALACTGHRPLRSILVALGAGSILSAQEITRVAALVWRASWLSLFRRMDWNDGQQPRVKLDTQLDSMIHFVLFQIIAWYMFFS